MKIRGKQKCVGLREIAKETGLSYFSLYYRARHRGDIPLPTHLLPNGIRKFYTPAEADQIIQTLKGE